MSDINVIGLLDGLAEGQTIHQAEIVNHLFLCLWLVFTCFNTCFDPSVVLQHQFDIDIVCLPD